MGDRWQPQRAAYEKLKFYQNLCEIRRLVYQLTERFPKGHLRLVSQMRDAARNAKQNIREGYSRDSVGEFGRAIRISRGSLSELEGDVDDCLEGRLIQPREHDMLKACFRLTKYQIDRYLDALAKLDKSGTWKSRFKATIRNRL